MGNYFTLDRGRKEESVNVGKKKKGKSSALKDGEALVDSLRSAYTATPTNLKVVYMAIVGSFPFNSFLSEFVSAVNKENKEFKDLSPERAYADFILCNLVLHLVIMNFLGQIDVPCLERMLLFQNFISVRILRQ
ncbi:hypothetical protein K7X08_027369 [Anisodus acutangulus]|uniref:Dolichyl-diphosphooligosaccharide--protein glycosyltransferase subunit DAD1 n=1 Tax=Anisodus acutangulus TaxID=402998 RepID=A0A9Q1RKX7_9SOLA|nr:hypothetical protein K7X08_027369 [Anisodus acutangulus]